ncbi:MAG: hypothetical protein LJE94_11390 [Deltaproteobacteria bacterium]|nr:hypothetical protein [Deltaproteobacteria bacterium]
MAKRALVWALTVTLCVTVMGGCSGLKRRDAAATGGDFKTAPEEIYLDFDDILIPENMKRDKERSFVFRIGPLSAGVLALKGRVPPENLIGFFDSNMSRDNWKAATSFRSPRSLLLFEKNTRWCIITITEDDFDHKTRVEIWVSPKSEEIDAGLIKTE